jgi:hypothetical protein
MLVHDGRSVGRGPAVAPFGERDDHGFEVEPLFRQVVRLMPFRPTRGGHESCLDEALHPRGENVGCNVQALLKIGEPRQTGEGRVTKDEQAPGARARINLTSEPATFMVPVNYGGPAPR